ncbi:hypothetical protein MKX01_020847 [Papaver californicum]|nr:hypothetical protein MKX01_020847 [Papaver californicum]
MEIGSSYFGIEPNDGEMYIVSRIWLEVIFMFSCINLLKYDAIMQSWQLSFNWGQGVAFQIRYVKPRVFTYVAWVDVDVETGPFNVTNVYEFHKGQWYLVHRHCSVVLITKGSGTWFTIV